MVIVSLNICYIGSSTILKIYRLHHFWYCSLFYSCHLNCITGEKKFILIINLHDFIFTLWFILFEHKKQYHFKLCRSSRKWQWSIIVCVVSCITTVVKLRRYIVTINLFHIINWLLEKNLYRFCRYNSNGDKFLFCFGEKLFLRFDWFYFSIYIKSLHESYLPLSTLSLILFFQSYYSNQLSAATATIFSPVVSDNRKLLKLFLLFDYSHFFDYHKVIVWVLLTIIYIISHLIFQTSDAKSTTHWHCFGRR